MRNQVANVAASDELICLGRDFLYPGAGTLLVSIWHVSGISTLYFMKRMEKGLRRDTSKSRGLREAQQFMMREGSWLHPAFLGSFQFIGDDQPPSSGSERIGFSGLMSNEDLPQRDWIKFKGEKNGNAKHKSESEKRTCSQNAKPPIRLFPG